MPSSDFDFVNTIGEGLGQRAEAAGLASLSPEEQTVLLAWWASGIIGNGGFRYFYEGASNAAQVASAFEALGFSDAANACRETLRVFPPEILSGDAMVRQQWLDANYSDAELTCLFAAQDAVIWEIDGQLETTAADYIRRHREKIELADHAE